MSDAARRARRWTAVIAAIAGFLVWNAVFDLWLGQGERQYLWAQAAHELGRGPAVSLKGSMDASMRDGVVVASGWALVVVLAVASASYLSFRLARREAPPRPR